MYANEFLLWLQGFKAAGGDPRSAEGRATIERILAGDQPDPICPECEHHVRQRWLEQYLSYYETDPAEA